MSEQSYTPKGRARTCPWISLRGKEWKAFKEMRDSQVAMLTIMEDIAQSHRDMVEIEKQKLELSQTITA